MKVSIIMPTYNVGKIILETISSVLVQTYSDWELIIVDDLSLDNTREILENVSLTDSRIKVVFSDVNNGAGITRNIAIQQASGRFIAFLDSDDIWHPHKLEKQVAHMITLNAPISHTSFKFIDESGNERPGEVNASSFVDLEHNLKYTEIGTSTAMIDLNIVEGDIKFSNIRARQDLKLWIDLLGRGYFSYGLNLPLVKYRVRSGSVSSNKIKMLWITLTIYFGIKNLSLTKRFSCYISYVFNAIKKRRQ